MPETEVKPELKVKAGSSCQCCPYGFHIDRDFVRYCASLYNNAQLDKLKQKKRERRRENKTVESYLGLNNSSCPDKQNGYFSSVEECRKSDKENFLCGLETVMMDFENTWQKSLQKNVFQNENSLNTGIDATESKTVYASTNKNLGLFDAESSSELFTAGQKSAFYFKLLRSNSDLSVSSRRANSATVSVKKLSQETSKISNFQRMTDTMATLSKEESCPCTVGIHRNILTNIREQIATSLKHMKELEEQVKCIPLLEVQVSALKEDKKVLLHWLKTMYKDPGNKFGGDVSKPNIESKIKNLDNENVSISQLSDNAISGCVASGAEDLSSPALASNLDAVLTKKHFVDSEIISHLTLDDDKALVDGIIKNKKSFKNIGISCSVLTRDVGVGHIQNKSKSIGVGDENFLLVQNCIHCAKEHNMKQFVSVSSESLGSDSDSADDIHRKPFDLKFQDRFSNSDSVISLTKTVSSSDMFTSTKSEEKNLKLGWNKTGTASLRSKNSLITSSKHLVDVGTVMDKQAKCVSTMTDLFSSDIISRKSLEKSKVLKSNKSTWCDNPVRVTKSIQVSFIKPKTYDASTIYDLKLQSHISTQTISITPPLLSEKNTKMCNSGTGERDVNTYSHLESRDIKVKSIGVGDFHVSKVICDKCQDKHAISVGCGISTVSDILCDKCKHCEIRTVGVGDININQLFCSQCSKNVNVYEAKEKPVMVNSVSTSTSVDIYNVTSSSNDIRICDKCSATIQSVAQDFASRSKEISDSPDPSSRIPKLNIFSATNKDSLFQPKCVKVKKTVLSVRKSPENVLTNVKKNATHEPTKSTSKHSNEGLKQEIAAEVTVLEKKNQ